MSTRKPCVNVPSASYSGKEQSPLHFGLSAEGYELNTIMEGFDHMLWIVKIKNNKKVWVRQSPVVGKMVHEEPVINNNSDTESNDSNHQKESNTEIIEEISQNTQELNADIKNPSPIPVIEQKPPPIMKATVEEKKINDYNLFLTYRLQEMKKEKKGTNKEIFNSVVAEWKELKKKPTELAKIIGLAQEFHNTKA